MRYGHAPYRPSACLSPCGWANTGGRLNAARGDLLGCDLEGSDETAALEAVVPGLAQPVARIAVLERVGGHHVIQLGERLVPDVLVPADMIGSAHRTRADFGQRAGGQVSAAAVQVPIVEAQLNRS